MTPSPPSTAGSASPTRRAPPRHLSPALSAVVALTALAAGCEREFTSLPGPRPEGCERQDPFGEDALIDDLAYLASPELDGRAPGTAGDEAARAFVAERFGCLGLTVVAKDDDYQQRFTDSEDNETGNVIAMIPGSGAGVSDESIVLSAHIDHFGYGWLGANDNASGVTTLLAIAQDMVNRDLQPERNVVFAVFGAEESGYEGSEYFMGHSSPGIDKDKIVYNVNMDMVGSYTESETLYAFGAFSGTPGREAVAAHAGEHLVLDVSVGEGSDESDNQSFCSRGVPYLFFWTDDRPCYHRRCDTSARIDFESMTDIAPLIGDVALDLADSPDAIGAVGCELER